MCGTTMICIPEDYFGKKPGDDKKHTKLPSKHY